MEKIEKKIETLFELDRYNDVLKHAYENLYLSNVNKEQLYQYIILSHINLSQDEKALSICDEALGIYPSFTTFLYLKAKILYYRSNYKKADKLIQQALQINPNHAQFLDLYARILLQKNSFKKAHLIIQKALELDSSIGEYQLTLALILMMLDEKKKAKEIVLKVLENEPYNSEALHIKQKLFTTNPQQRKRLLKNILFLDPFDKESQKDLKFLHLYYKIVPFLMVFVVILIYFSQSNYPTYLDYKPFYIPMIALIGMIGSYDWRLNIPFLVTVLTINSYFLTIDGFKISDMIGIIILALILHFILKVILIWVRIIRYKSKEIVLWMKN